MYFSKSQYLRFRQCPKSFWLLRNKPELIESQQCLDSILEKAKQVGLVARELYPQGVEVEYWKNLKSMTDKTTLLINSGVETIYEAVFIYDNSLVICDILHRDENGWNIYEVKSSTKVKERHLDDISFQYNVLKKIGLEIGSVNLVYINNKYERVGDLDLQQLFVIEDRKDELESMLQSVTKQIIQMKDILKGDEPSGDIGLHCEKYEKENLPCDFRSYCWKHIPDYSVFNITRLGKRKWELYENGIINIEDIPEDYPLSLIQRIQVDAHIQDRDILQSDEVKAFISQFAHPLYFLDFETFQQAIPLFDQLKPYQQIPFQYSLHFTNHNNELVHKEFLADEGKDPRRTLAERLINDLPGNACVVAYNMSFEKTVIKSLAQLYPDLEQHLMQIHDNIVDLMIPFQKKWYYTNSMRGSASIKYVLPALYPDDDELDYSKLNVQNGQMAMGIFENLHLREFEEIKEIRKDLLQYCRLDTLAMVRIWEKLKSL